MVRGPSKSFDPSEILDLAMMEFWKRGYSATSVSHLRAATGLGAKSMYDTYGGKREMFLAAIDHYGETRLKHMFDDVVANHSADMALTTIFGELVKIGRQTPHFGCLLGVAAVEAQSDPELQAAIDRQFRRICKALELALTKMEFEPGAPAPREMAAFLMVLFQGGHLVGRIGAERAYAEAAVSIAEQLINAWRKS